MSTDSNLPESRDSAKSVILVLLLLVHTTIFFFGGYWVQFLLLDNQTVFDKSDPWTVSNFSLITAWLAFFISRPVLVRISGAWKDTKIFLVQCGSALVLYCLMILIAGAWFLETKVLRAGEKYHVAFVDGNGYQIRGDSVYRLPVHSKKRGNQISTSIQYGNPPFISNTTDTEAESVWTLGIINRLAPKFSDFQVRVYLNSVVLSFIGGYSSSHSQNLPNFIAPLAARHANDKLDFLIYTRAKPLDATLFVDVPYHSVALIDFQTPQSTYLKKVKHVGDYVEFEMELIYQPSGHVSDPTELQVIDYRRSFE